MQNKLKVVFFVVVFVFTVGYHIGILYGQVFERTLQEQIAELDISNSEKVQLNRLINDSGLSQQELISLYHQVGQDLQTFKKELGRRAGISFDIDTLIFSEQGINDTLLMLDTVSSLADDFKERKKRGDYVYGTDLFVSGVRYQPIMMGPVGPDYELGPMDELILTVTGDVELQRRIVIDREGRIFIPDVGQITVVGLTLEGLEKKIFKRLSRIYSGIKKGKRATTFYDFSLNKLRSIQIYVIGEANIPGSYTISSLSTVFDAMYACNGPSEKSSLRKINLIRNNKIIQTIDFYDYLINGYSPDNIRLQNGDIIHFTTIGKTVRIKGKVLREAIYEIKENEVLTDLIKMAGGLLPNAYGKKIQVKRIHNHKSAEIIDIDYLQLTESDEKFPLENGDIITVFSVYDLLENIVTLNGHVSQPGTYAYRPGMRVKNLFDRANGVLEGAYLDRVDIIRTDSDMTKSIISLNLKKLFNGDETQNLVLQKFDSVHVAFAEEYLIDVYVNISGQIKHPGQYQLLKNMTLKDLLFQTGGLLDNAYTNKIEVSRIDTMSEVSGNIVELINISDHDLNYGNKSENPFYLQKYDNVFVRTDPDWEPQRIVEIKGEVHFPGIYSLRTKSDGITDVIQRAGGLKENTAYIQGFTLLRKEAIAGEQGYVAVDLEKVLKDPESVDNLVLVDGDVLTIPEKIPTVKVVGEVMSPTNILFHKGKDLEYYITLAGGYTEDADKGRVIIRYANREVKKARRRFRGDYKPGFGSMIVVPKQPEKEKIDYVSLISTTLQVIGSTTALIIAVLRI